jgi:hypothetical protein
MSSRCRPHFFCEGSNISFPAFLTFNPASSLFQKLIKKFCVSYVLTPHFCRACVEDIRAAVESSNASGPRSLEHHLLSFCFVEPDLKTIPNTLGSDRTLSFYLTGTGKESTSFALCNPTIIVGYVTVIGSELTAQENAIDGIIDKPTVSSNLLLEIYCNFESPKVVSRMFFVP